MRLLLANPPCREDIDEKFERFFIRAGSRWPFSVIKKKNVKIDYAPFPFYLAYTAALLQNENFNISVIDAIPLNMTLDEFVNKSISIHPDLILFETATPTIYYDLKIAKRLKEETSALIALCGTHASTFPIETLKESEYVDFILTREYEFNFVELIKKLSEGKDVHDVPGLAYRDKKKISVTSSDKLVELDKLPFPARHFFPSNDYNDMNLYWDGFCQYKPAIQMHASRGCPFSCNFCLWNQVMYKNGKYRMFSPERIVDEMEEVIIKYGAHEIYFDDDIFTANKKHVLSICRELKERGLDINWSCMGDAMITDKEMINAMADAGCIGMKFGVESGDSEILKIIKKPVDLSKVKDVSNCCAERGIKTHATFTFGLSGETKKSMEKTLSFSKELDVDSVQFSITTPFPGTQYYEELEKKGLLITKDWTAYNGSCNFVVKNSDLIQGEIENFCKNSSKIWLNYKIKDFKWVKRQIYNLNRIRKGQGNIALLMRLNRAFKSIIQ